MATIVSLNLSSTSVTRGGSVKATPNATTAKTVTFTATADDGSTSTGTLVINDPQTLSTNPADKGKAGVLVLEVDQPALVSIAVDPDGTEWDITAA